MKMKTLTSTLIALGALVVSNAAHAGAIVEGTCYMQTEKAIVSSSCKSEDTSCEKGKSICAIKGQTDAKTDDGGRADFQNFTAINKGTRSLFEKGHIWYNQPDGKRSGGKPKMQSMAAAPCVNPFEPCGGGIGMGPKPLGLAINTGDKGQVLIGVDVLPPVCDGCTGYFIYRKLEGRHYDLNHDWGIEAEDCMGLMVDWVIQPC